MPIWDFKKVAKATFSVAEKWLTKGTPKWDLKKVAKATFSVAENGWQKRCLYEGLK